jgi:N-acetylglutamate synthase-like GNAT family acetyltransferase
MIDIRRLHASEFDLLKEVDDGFTPDPDKSIAMVAQNGSRIIARIFLVAPSHAEGIWIDSDYRGSKLGEQIVAALEIEARAEGITKMFAYAVKPEMEHYISRRCGYTRLPWVVLQKELTCRQR